MNDSHVDHSHIPQVVITRPHDQSEQFEKLLTVEGLRAKTFPTITIEPLALNHHLEVVLDRIGAGDFLWIIFSSANAVRTLAHALQTRGIAGIPKGTRVASQGPRTAEAVRVLLNRSSDLVPQVSVAENFAHELRERIPSGSSVVLPSAERTRGVIDSTLDAAGIAVTHLPLYRTIPARYDVGLSSQLQQVLAHDPLVALFSPSAVEGLCALLSANLEEMRDRFRRLRCASIGPITSRAIRDIGGFVAVEARDHTDEGLCRAVVEYVRGAPK